MKLSSFLMTREISKVSHYLYKIVTYYAISQSAYVEMRKCGVTILMYIRPTFAHYVHCPLHK